MGEPGGTVGHCFCRVDMGPDPRNGRGTLSSVQRKGSRSPQEDGCFGSVGDLALATLDSDFRNRRICHAAAGAFAVGCLDHVAIQAQGSLWWAAVQVCVPLGVGLCRLATICTQPIHGYARAATHGPGRCATPYPVSRTHGNLNCLHEADADCLSGGRFGDLAGPWTGPTCGSPRRRRPTWPPGRTPEGSGQHSRPGRTRTHTADSGTCAPTTATTASRPRTHCTSSRTGTSGQCAGTLCRTRRTCTPSWRTNSPRPASPKARPNLRLRCIPAMCRLSTFTVSPRLAIAVVVRW